MENDTVKKTVKINHGFVDNKVKSKPSLQWKNTNKIARVL